MAMTNIRELTSLVVLSASLVLTSFIGAGTGRAQEIRRIAGPNQSIKVGRGGYVCEGQLTETLLDNTEDWSYEMVSCTGPIYNANDYTALHAKLGHDEFVKLNAALDRLNATSSSTQEMLRKQVQTFNNNLRAEIEKRFHDLPNDLVQSPAIQNLKKSLMDYVNERLPTTGPNKSPATQQTTAPPSAQQGSAPDQH
jgi:hypothetical protein